MADSWCAGNLGHRDVIFHYNWFYKISIRAGTANERRMYLEQLIFPSRKFKPELC